jgi:hypothetical protein
VQTHSASFPLVFVMLIFFATMFEQSWILNRH